MKSAKEWTDYRSRELMARSCSIEEFDIKFIKAIQLDAWKQGMSDAATIVNDFCIDKTDRDELVELIYKQINESLLK